MGRRRSRQPRSLTSRYVVATSGATFLLLACWGAFSVWQVAGHLRDARDASRAMITALGSDDRSMLTRQAESFAESANEAAAASDGLTWNVLGALPVIGDDLDAVAAVSSSLAKAADGAFVPLVSRLTEIDRVAVDGRLDTRLMADIQPDVRRAAAALGEAHSGVDGLRSQDYVGIVGEAVQQWTQVVDQAARGTRDAARTLEVLPEMLGTREPQRILLVFQTNAEIRASGGLPGSWSLIEANDGRLTVLQQGTGGGIDQQTIGAAATTAAEQAIWGPQLGLYFRDATMTPDFGRAAELMHDHWKRTGAVPLDGVISLDVVAASYLLQGLGPVEVSGQAVDSNDLAPTLLNTVYEEVPIGLQDEVFASVARSIVGKVVANDISSAQDLLTGIARGMSENRIHASWFDPEVEQALSTTSLSGRFDSKPGRSPVVDVTLDDATGGKMSYFLRHEVEIEAVECAAGRQRIEGRLRLWQTVSAEEASGFAPYVTGAGQYGVPPGQQVVLVRLFGPVAGSLISVTVAGEELTSDIAGVARFRERPVITLALQPSSRPQGSVVTWAMVTGNGQIGAVRLGVTPGVEEGTQSRVVASACNS